MTPLVAAHLFTGLGRPATAEQWLIDRRSEWEKRHDRFEEYAMSLKDKENDNAL